MRLKLFASALCLLLAMQSFSQNESEISNYIDLEEDTTTVTSLQEILNLQELAYAKTHRADLIKSVWKRKKHFSLSFAKTSLTGNNLKIYDPVNKEYVPSDVKYETDWAINLKRSRTYALHKKAIADILSFGLEFTVIDLSANHFKKDSTAHYNSDIKYTVTDENKGKHEYNYIPWGAEMYTFSYGMNIGPSITIAPFARMNNPGLAHLRIQGYFTVGYRGSLMWMRNDKQMDHGKEKDNYDKVHNSNKLSWSHGLTTAWGFRLNWKAIAFGCEFINAKHNFKPIETHIYGKNKYKFTESSMRLSLIYTW